MLVIGHRGAAGLAPENTLESLRAGKDAGADILEFDVRITADGIPILCHDPTLHGRVVRKTTYSELKKLGNVTKLTSVLDEFLGDILLNLEYKPFDGIEIVYALLNKKYITSPNQWDTIIISSFHIRVLWKLRSLSKHVNLALLHSVNPFAFVTYNRKLKLAAVGWHRLHVNKLAIEIAKKSKLFTYVYTVNRPQAAKLLAQRDIDAVVTDYPKTISTSL
ncbi:glycerophosphodiester phosphodiesterase [Candidatus Saccharibacteria bacterium]|nr:glycerophosphodiester phosphodiesterase [Candidatus Saccharibacteria bacterium]